ncbi:MAG: ABC transporter permease [Candidatus Hydrogenedentes bacterium]|nr:ABC transporter permease [Candidatus Hydrogenedentota bacterium]
MKLFIAKHSPLFLLAALCILLAVASEDFRRFGNLKSVAGRTSEIGVISAGELLVILTGGIDLSVGSVAALGGVVSCQCIKVLQQWQLTYLEGTFAEALLGVESGWLPVIAGTLIGALVGLGCGLMNGLIITKGRVPPFIVTLGTMMWARGLALICSGGNQIFGMPPAFPWLGGTKQIYVTSLETGESNQLSAWWVPVLLMLLITLGLSLMLNFARLGRAIYATGGSLQAARLSGLSVDRVRITVYGLSGLLAGFAGVILASRTSVAAPTGAEMYELEAVAACVIGGASLMGGEGGAFAALAGALIMVVLRNYCNLENINVYWQQVFVGGLIVILVFYDNYRKRKAGLLKDA